MSEEENQWWVYIIHTHSDTFYTGITNNLEKRWQTHLQGKGSKYLRTHKPKEIVFTEAQKDRGAATSREIEIKAFSRDQKLNLIEESTR